MRAPERPRQDRLVITACVLGACAPIVVALVRALSKGWYPVGDNAYFSIRARDVLTQHHPLLGTWTSASLSVGNDINNPGPLLFDLLALPAKLAPVTGVAIGTAILNLVCVVVMATVAHRRGGTARTVGVLLAAAALAWTMGSELLIDPWQPHALLFPFLLYLVLVWSLVEGDVRLLPLAVGTASLLVQTHLSYAVLVPLLGLLGVGAVAVRSWRLRRVEPDAWPGERRRLRNTAAVTLLVAAVCWAQPVIEQLTADSGNLGRLVASGGDSGGHRIGLSLATRFLAGAMAVPPAWARPSFGESFVELRLQNPAPPVEFARTPSLVVGLLGLAALASVLVVAWFVSRRRGDGGAAGGVVVAGAACVLALLTTAALPIGRVGIGPHQVRWLWPIGILCVVSAALGLGGRRPAVVHAMAVLTVVLGLATLPTHRSEAGPVVDSYAMPVMRAVASELDGVTIEDPVLVADADLRKMRIFEPYSTPVMLELLRRGIDIEVDDPSQARQLGDGRFHPERATHRLVVREGDEVTDVPRGATRLAYVAGLDGDERAELARLRQDLTAELPGRRLGLTSDGRKAADLGLLPGVDSTGNVDVDVAMAARGVVDAAPFLVPGTRWVDEVERYADLQWRWDRMTLAVFLVPIEGASAEVRP